VAVAHHDQRFGNQRHEDAVGALRQFLAEGRYQDREEIPEARELLGRCYQLQKKYPDWLETVSTPKPQTTIGPGALEHHAQTHKQDRQ
jgi:hypothetical protein